MKVIQKMTMVGALGLALAINAKAQTNLQFTSVNATPEGAIQLHWASTNHEIYQVQYANALATNADGSTAWQMLYDQYPSQGTNTFIGDFGNYNLVPIIPHPKYSPMRFYRVLDEGQDSLASDEPAVSITSPTNGDAVNGELTITVVAATDQPVISGTKLYVDGQEMRPPDSFTNWSNGSTNYEMDTYGINSCEWGNGTHNLFATIQVESGYGDQPGSGSIATGYAVSSFVPVVFSNLVTRISFSQYFFDPASGQTQQVSAVFAANSDWTLNITDASSNSVQTASGSGTSMLFNWDGTGTGGTNLPAGIYYYYITAQTNGLAPQDLSGGGNADGSGGSPPAPAYVSSAPELWAVAPNSENVVPLAIYPPGFDTNGLIIFSATPSEVEALTASSSANTGSVTTMNSGDSIAPDFSGPSPQSAPKTPQRPPTNPVRGVSGTFGVAYQTYTANGTSGFSLTPLLDGTGIPGEYIQMENFQANANVQFPPLPQFKYDADAFISGMKEGGWMPSFVKIDDQLKMSDLIGSGTPFNQVSLGILMVHGVWGNSLDYKANGCFQMYFPITSGTSAQYLRMSQMNLGGSGASGLKWMVIYACSSLYQNNFTSMQMAGVLPINSNLHLLLGADTAFNTDYYFLRIWARSIVGLAYPYPQQIRSSWYSEAQISYGATHPQVSPIRFAVGGHSSAWNDTIQSTNPPSGDIQYETIQVYP